MKFNYGIKICFVFCFFLGASGFTVASDDDTTEHVKRLRNEPIKAIDVADFFVVLDQKEHNLSKKKIDPLKLQKILYYAFSHFKVNLNRDLWNIDYSPIISNFHGPFIREVHSKYNGYVISPSLAEEQLKRNFDLFDVLEKHTLIAIYFLYINESGKDLERNSHKELPYSRVPLRSPLLIEDIQEEFSTLHQKLPFLRVMCRVCPLIHLTHIPGFRSLTARDFASLLETNDNEELLGKDVQHVLSDIVYPIDLLNNVDAKDSLLCRSDVIERVAVSARMGNYRAKVNLAEVFELFSVDPDDNYAKTAEIIRSSLESGEEKNKEKASGYCNYLLAGTCHSKKEAQKYYEDSLLEGYSRAAFEIAKIKKEEGLPDEELNYLKKAFDRGMLTATDMMIDLNIDTSIKKEYLEKRGKKGDPMGYYKLACIYEQQGNMEEAISFYKKSLPFFGYTELIRLRPRFQELMRNIDLSETELDKFFENIILMYNQEKIKEIWGVE